MTNAQRMRLVGQEPQDNTTLRDELDAIIDERRGRMLELARESLRLWTKLGMTQVYVDEFPELHRADHGFLRDWLEEQGMEVRQPRFSRRLVVILQEVSA